ncbi:MAG: hypothetical protein LH470_09555 [Lysobacter sp.]|nr:hypothetical protein [Lysobacter sp.]
MAKPAKKPPSKKAQGAVDKTHKRLKDGFPAFAQAPTSARKQARGTVLKLLRSLPAHSKLNPHQLNKLIDGVVDVLKKEGITPKHLGGKSYRQVAVILIELREVISYTTYSLKRLKESRGGLAFAFKGKLFELFVHNHPELHADFKKMGRLQRDLFLNDTVLKRKAKPKTGQPIPKPLINAKGKPVEVSEKFEAPVKVEKIWISDGKGSREFIDIPYVCLSPKAGVVKPGEAAFFVSPVVSVEIKTRGVKSEGALKGAGPQVSEHLARWRDAKTVGMEIDGVSITFKPEDILFNPTSHTPVVVTTARSTFTDYEFRRSSVGSREASLVVGIPVDTQALNKIVGLLFPR